MIGHFVLLLNLCVNAAFHEISSKYTVKIPKLFLLFRLEGIQQVS